MMVRTSIAAAWLATLLLAQDAAWPVLAETLAVGYVEIENDDRYNRKRMRAEFPMQPLGRPWVGAETALGESRVSGATRGVEFELDRLTVRDPEELVSAVEGMVGRGVRYLISDLPAAELATLGAAMAEAELLILNISARDDELRSSQCQLQVLHIIPSFAMLYDALAQYLVARKWRDVLVLQGPLPADEQLLAAFDRSARRMGLNIVARKPFLLSNDPRQRERNNIALLTSGEDYDVVFVADSQSEFSRDLPFRTQLPRPVVGSAGLVPAAWSWAWERHGAPQLNKRFEKRADRHMGSFDWAAWMAFKAIVEAVLRTGNGNFEAVREFLLSAEIILDGFKGNRSSFRAWDHQLRQPLLLTTPNWVVERAPIRGFLHPANNLDTLGFDQRESRCGMTR